VSSFTVQRAPVGGTFVNIATVSATTYTDTTIDPYLQYTYRIVGGNGTASPGQVTVGPPPAGISLAAQAPMAGTSPAQGYGVNDSLVIDSNGDPAIAFLWRDPNNIGNYTQSRLMFRNWNRAQASWNPVVTVGTVGDVNTNFRQPLSLGYDASTKAFAIATEDDSSNLRIYTSPDGVTWTLAKTYSSAGVSFQGPSLALAGGNLYLSVEADTVGAEYISGKLSDPTSWTVKHPGSVSGVGIGEYDIGTSIALDNSGIPGIAYWAQDPKSDTNFILLYWRPTTGATPVKVTDTQNNYSDLAVKVTYYKANPRIVFLGQRNDAEVGDAVHFVRSDDGGTTWQTPVAIPPDGTFTTDFPFDMAINSKGAAAIEFGQNAGSGDNTCGAPKLSVSTDLLNWKTCVLAQNIGDYGSYPYGEQLYYQGNDKLLSTWWNATDSQVNTGVILYREPPDNQPSGPVIANVLDAESSRATLVGGEWAAVYGANLSQTARAWAASDFTNGNTLPTSLDGTSVTFNGIPAAVYFVSSGQIDVQVPSGLTGTVPVVVTRNGSPSASFNTTIVANAPSLYYYPGGTKVYAAAQHPVDSSLIGDPAVMGTVATKAKPGEVIVLYVNGLAAAPSGTILGAIPYNSPVTVKFNNTTVTAAYAGVAFAGGFQVNVQVPPSLTPGDYTLIVSTQGQSSGTGVIIPVGN
jgi:uncharacterized protein (TIGR03437 family)